MLYPDLQGDYELIDDEDDGRQADWYYVRVFETNGEMAWSSPIWVGGA